jgi:two-component system CheB/CheR fusion protein
MDIISFRNVAIYMDSTLQKKVFGMLGYSLKQSGFLILSSSESLSAYNEMFRIVDSKHKIYAKASHNMRITPHFETPFINQESAKRNLKMKKPIKGRSDGEQEVGDAALPKSREVGRLLKEAMDILQIRGETDPSKKSLRSMIQEKDNANEKLKSALEEVQSSNEELQSMNEEIETAKEELESSNEELTALNDELQERNVELKETQKKLEASGNFNHNIVETINESILVLDRRLRIVSANKHFYKEFKAEASKIENKLIYRIMGNSWNIPELRELLEKILPKKSHFENFEITQKFPKIGIKVVRLNARRIYDHDKKSDLILLAMLDISRIKELEMSNEDAHKKVESILNRDNETLERIVRERTAELLKTRLELEKAKRLSDIGTLASTVAHELRNPLAAIRVALFNVKRKTQEESISHSLETIEKKINESAQIINNLLFYARIQKSDHEPVDLFHIISEIVDTTIKRYSRQKVDVSCSLDFLKNTPISADPLQMKEVFNNLLNNSFDAVANMQGKIEIYGKADNNNVTISIKDNGGGIAKDVLEHIYEPFFTTKSKGTGLGLSVVRQIISLHNGDIAFASELNKGTEVTVTLPIK